MITAIFSLQIYKERQRIDFQHTVGLKLGHFFWFRLGHQVWLHIITDVYIYFCMASIYGYVLAQHVPWWFHSLVGVGWSNGWGCTKLSWLASQVAWQSVYLPISHKLDHSIFIVRYHISHDFTLYRSLLFPYLTFFIIRLLNYRTNSHLNPPAN